MSRPNPSSSGGGVTPVPPQDFEAEQAVLGAMMLGDANAVDEAADLLLPGDFYRENHATVFRAMLALRAAGGPVDLVMLRDELAKRKQLEAVGGQACLMALADVTFTTANLAHYARIVRDKATLRRMIETGAHLTGMGYSDPPDLPAALADAERRVLAIQHERDAGAWTPLSEALRQSLDELDARYHAGGQIIGTRTGLGALDLTLGGLRDGDLVIVAARPGMGKTGMAAGMGTHAAQQHGKRVAFFSLEMSKTQIADRIACAEAGVDSERYRDGLLSEDEWQRVNTAMGRLWETPLFIEDASDLSVNEIRSRCRRLQAQGGVDLVIVDYLQLMRGEGRGGAENRVHEVTEMARGLKSLARELDAPVVALAQLSRGVERREDKRPLLSDLRDSGGIEEAADVVLFLYRPAYYARDEGGATAAATATRPDEQEPEEAEVIIAKHRKGRTGTVKVGFEAPFVRFVNLPEGGRL